MTSSARCEREPGRLASFAEARGTYTLTRIYKFEQAARKGAVGVLIIHRTDLAAYGWDVVRNSNSAEKTFIAHDANPHLQTAS